MFAVYTSCESKVIMKGVVVHVSNSSKKLGHLGVSYGSYLGKTGPVKKNT